MVDDKCIADIKTISAFSGKELDIPDLEVAGLVIAIFQAILSIVHQK